MSKLPDYGFIIVEPVLIDVIINDPFRVKINDVLVEPIYDMVVNVTLPPLLVVYPPELDIEVKISYIEDLSYTGVSFEDVLTAVPLISEISVTLPEEYKEVVEKRLKELMKITISTPVEKYSVEVKPLLIREVPEDLRDRFTIKIKIRSASPEIKEIIENRLTKEFRITRLVKRMEIIRDPRYLYELELVLSEIERLLGLRARASRRPRRVL